MGLNHGFCSLCWKFCGNHLFFRVGLKKILFFVSLNEEEETKNATSYEESHG